MFRLEVDIVLCCAAIISALVFVVQLRSESGTIKLPLEGVGTTNGHAEHDDPFNVTKPEDVLDGEPIQEKEFWQATRRRKQVLLVIVVALNSVQIFVLERAIIAKGWGQDALCGILQVIFGLYILALSIIGIRYPATSWHGLLMIHLSALSTLALFSLSTTTIIQSRTIKDLPERIGWYGSLFLWLLAFWLSVHMRRCPALYYPLERIYLNKFPIRTSTLEVNNVCGSVGASLWDTLLFSYTTKVVKLGNTIETFSTTDLPVLSGGMRATALFASMRDACRRFRLRGARPGSGWQLAYRLLRVNGKGFALHVTGVVVVAVLYYGPMLFMQRLVSYLELDPEQRDPSKGWIYGAGLLVSSVVLALVIGQLWSLALTNLQVKIRAQLNTLLFAKTLVRKDITTATVPSSNITENMSKAGAAVSGHEFPSKAQIMTLMTTDVDRVAEFVWYFYTLVASPIEITVGAVFLYRLLGVSSLIGLAVSCLFLPVNNIAGTVIVRVQEKLMKTRDERLTIMNEVLGAMRMLKFMAWERSFEARIIRIRDRELKYQHLTFTIELLFITIWNISPLLVTLISFWHYAVFRDQGLTPSIAFTSIAIFSKLKYALNAIPGTIVNAMQGFVSIRRIEKYLCSAEVDIANSFSEDGSEGSIAFRSATVAWPQGHEHLDSVPPTPHLGFSLADVTLEFPADKLSLVCGKLGSGKTLLLLALLGEVDILTGEVECPRSPPNAIASFAGAIPSAENWIVSGACAYVPQTTWLRNASVKENILFNLPYVEERYQKALEACALKEDLTILEDGDETEIGERGVNLSGGQKARGTTLTNTAALLPLTVKEVSLARAIYSRASVLLLDDVLSAVDVHTAHHVHEKCLKGELARDRTIILVSHHVQLCMENATYVVALDNGRVSFSGTPEAFQASGVMAQLTQSTQVATPEGDPKGNAVVSQSTGGDFTFDYDATRTPQSRLSGDGASEWVSELRRSLSSKAIEKVFDKKTPRKLVEEEKQAVGNIGQAVWTTYFAAVGGTFYWIFFILFVVLAAAGPVAENGWLSHWSGLVQRHEDVEGSLHYISIYALITLVGLITSTLRWSVLYHGTIRASTIVYKRLLESVLFAQIRFHDTVSRGRLLNRFGKDMEVIDSSLPDHFGNTVIYFTSASVTLLTITYVGGPKFLVVAFILAFVYYETAKVYGRCCRDLRRLDSVSRSPLYSIYEEAISGAPVLRAFGAGSEFMRDMICYVDISTNPYYWLWKVNQWVSIRINLLSCVIIGLTAVMALVNPDISASLAGFTLAFATTVTQDLRLMVERFVELEQSMVAVERVNEYSDLPKEGPEIVEPRPPSSWPSKGAVECKDLTIRYAPDLPDVLHKLTFKVNPGEKVGIVGRTGSGKSTLALSFFRFVEVAEGRITIDGIDISRIGLTDLRSRITIIPQDPVVFSGTLRTTLDVFDEHIDAELFEALRRVRLIPSSNARDISKDDDIFCNLETRISEGGDNLSAGQKQLLCLARAILKRSRVLVMDEATASVDYATDELIGKTIKSEFVESTIFTIAHRLRTVIDYNRVMVLDQGRIVEFDRPAMLLSNPSSQLYALCKAEGEEEFAILKKLAGVK